MRRPTRPFSLWHALLLALLAALLLALGAEAFGAASGPPDVALYVGTDATLNSAFRVTSPVINGLKSGSVYVKGKLTKGGSVDLSTVNVYTGASVAAITQFMPPSRVTTLTNAAKAAQKTGTSYNGLTYSANNANVTISNPIQVNGNLSISGSGTYSFNSVYVTGNVTISASAAKFSFASLYVGGTLKVTGGTAMGWGPTYVVGDTTLSGAGQWNVGLFVTTGNMTISGAQSMAGDGVGADPKPTTILMTGSGKTLTISGATTCYGLLCNLNGGVSITAATSIKGSVLCGGAFGVSAAATIAYNPDVARLALDVTPPTTTASVSPTPNAAGWNKTTPKVTLSATDNAGGSGVASSSYSVDGASPAPYASPFSVTGDAVHTVAYSSVDKAGNAEAANSVTVRVDTTVPSAAAISTPAAGACYKVMPASFSGTAADATSGLQSVTFTLQATSGSHAGQYWTGSAWQGTSYALATNNAASWTSACGVTWPAWTDGTYAVTATATDKAGNSFVGAPVSFTYDVTAPSSAVVTVPAANAFYNAGTMPKSFSGTAADVTSGLQAVTFTLKNAAGKWWNGSAWTTGATNLAATVSGTNWTSASSVTWPSWTDGTYTVTATATDKAGNRTTGAPVGFAYDNTKPMITVTVSPQPSANANGWNTTPVFLTFNPTAGVSGIGTVEYKLDTSTTPGSWTLLPPDATGYHVTVSTDGQYTLSYRATSVAGLSNTGSRQFKIDTIAPASTASVTAGTLGQNGWYRSDATVTLSASDATSGVASGTTQYSTDSKATWQTGTSLTVATGTTTIWCRSTDNAGNVEQPAAAALTVKVDKAAPDTTITSGPEDGAWTSSKTPTYSFVGSDDQTALAQLTYQYQVDNTGAWTACTSSFTLPALADGTHTVAFRAVDLAGNCDASPATRTIRVDTTTPQVTITSPNCQNGGTTPYNEPVITFKATPAGGSQLVGDAQVALATFDTATQTFPDPQTVTPAPVSGSHWPTPLDNGTYRLTVSAVNTAGVAGKEHFDFTVKAPDITVKSSSPWEGDLVGLYADTSWIPPDDDTRPQEFSWTVTKPGDPAAITSDAPFGFVALDTKATYNAELKITDDVATDPDGNATRATGAVSVVDTTVSTTPVSPRVHALNCTVFDGQPADLVGRLIDPGWSQTHTATWTFDKNIGNVPAYVDEDNYAFMGCGYVYGTTPVLHTDESPITGYLTVSDGTSAPPTRVSFKITVRDNDLNADEQNNQQGSTSPALDDSAPNITNDGEILQSYEGSENDVDIFEVTDSNGNSLPCGTQVLVTLGNLSADYDLAVIEDASQQPETAVKKVGLEGTSFPNGDAWANASGIWGHGGGVWGHGGGVWGHGGGVWGHGGGVWGHGGMQDSLGAMPALQDWTDSPVSNDTYSTWMNASGVWGHGGGVWGHGGGVWGHGSGIWGHGGGVWGHGGGIWGHGGGVWGHGGGVWGHGGVDAEIYRSPDASMLYSHLAPNSGSNQLDGYSFDDLGFTGMDATRTAGGDITFEELGFNNQEAAGKSICGMSAHSGTETEVVLAQVQLVGGRTFIAVKGANGACDTTHPYTLQVETSSPLNLSKLLNTKDESPKVTGTAATDNWQPLCQQSDSSPTTLFVTQDQRMSVLYPDSWPGVKNTLISDCDNPLIDGDVISVASNMYDAWDKQPWNTQRANDVADGVRQTIQTYIYGHGQESDKDYVAPHTSIRYVVLVGSDEIVPQYRVSDQTVLGNELSYAYDSGLNIDSALLGSMYDSMVLTDDAYVDPEPIPYNGRSLYIPKLAIGRLVETPQEIAGSLKQFIDSSGILDAGTSVMSSVVTGQDWMKDGAQRVKDILAKANLTPSDTVPFGTWTVQTAENALAPTSAKIANLNAHFTHYAGISADGCTRYANNDEDWSSEVLTSDEIASSPSFTGKLVFTLGCHAGLNVPDDQAMGEEWGMSPKLDVAQAIAQQKGVMVASTGFGLGNLDGVGGTEDLIGKFADQMTTAKTGSDTGQPIGLALAMAKRQFFLSKASVTPYDEKSSIEFTLYGMPQYRVKCTTHVPKTGLQTTGDQNLASATWDGHFEPATFTMNITDGDQTVPVTTQLIEPATSTQTARYITSTGDAQTTAGRPVEYRVVYDLGVASADAVTAAIVSSGTYEDIPDFNPAIGHATDEWEANPRESQICSDGWWPASPVMVSTIQTPDGPDQQLVVTGQFMRTSDEGDEVIGTQRVWTHLNIQLVRQGAPSTQSTSATTGTSKMMSSMAALDEATTDSSSADDNIPPTVTKATLYNQGFDWTANVEASDPSGISRIDVIRIGDDKAKRFTQSFTPVPTRTDPYLVDFSLPDVPRDDVAVMLEVYDGVNNVTTVTAKGYLVTGPPSGSMTLNHGVGTTYGRLVTLDSSDVINARDMRVSFDNGTTWSGWQPYLHTATIALPAWLDAVHVTVEYRNEGPGKLDLSADLAVKATPMDGGDSHSVALKSDGSRWAWGDNVFGALGDPALGSGPYTTPRTIPGATWEALQAGASFTVGLKQDGTLWSWGSTGWPTDSACLGRDVGSARYDATPGQVGNASWTWKAIAVGEQHTLAIRSDGTLWGWGRNDHGQVGNNTTSDCFTLVEISNDPHWVAIAAGDWHSLGLKDDGTLWAWGTNQSGELGNGSGSDQHQPVRVGADKNWVAIAAGYMHSLALKADGSLWTWGVNSFGQLGDGTTANESTPIQVGIDASWTAVAGGWESSYALRSDGTLWAWGYNTFGDLGTGTAPNKETSPTRVGIADDWVAVAAGYEYGLGLRSDGQLRAWGWEAASGTLGDGNQWGQQNTPVSVNLQMTDATPPVTTVQDPGFDDNWHATAVAIHLSATDAGGSGISHVEYRIDESVWLAVPGGTATVPVLAPSDGTNDGTHIVRYRAVDNAGNVEATKSGKVRIDTTPPVTNDDAPSVTVPGPVTVTLTAQDDGAGMIGGQAKTEYSLDGGGWTIGTSVDISDTGMHELLYHSLDAIGNTEDDHDISVSIGQPAAVTSPSFGETWVIGSTHTITWNPSGFSTIGGAWLSRDGGTTWEPLPGLPWEDDGDGDWTVTAPATTTAIIEVDNDLGTAYSGAFTIAISPPTIAASAGNHGSISPSGNVSVPYGSDQGFAITPDNGYHLDSLTLDGTDVKGEATHNTDGTWSYTVTNVEADHSLSANFAVDTWQWARTLSTTGFGPTGIAGDSAGNVFVANISAKTVEEFSSSGNHVTTIGSAGTGDGQFQNPRGVAVYNGELYVSDVPGGTSNRIEVFSLGGTYSRTISCTWAGAWAPDAMVFDASGNMLVLDGAGVVVDEVDPVGGTYLGSMAVSQVPSPVWMARDQVGNLYITGDTGTPGVSSTGHVFKYSASGTLLKQWDLTASTHTWACGIAVDSATGFMYVADQSSPSAPSVDVFTLDGDEVATFRAAEGGGTAFVGPFGVSVGADGTLYVGDYAAGTVQAFTRP